MNSDEIALKIVEISAATGTGFVDSWTVYKEYKKVKEWIEMGR